MSAVVGCRQVVQVGLVLQAEGLACLMARPLWPLALQGVRSLSLPSSPEGPSMFHVKQSADLRSSAVAAI